MSTILNLYIHHQFTNLLNNKQTDHINIFYQNQYFYLYILIQFKYFNEIKGSVNIIYSVNIHSHYTRQSLISALSLVFLLLIYQMLKKC